jgi:hypothetical protein
MKGDSFLSTRRKGIWIREATTTSTTSNNYNRKKSKGPMIENSNAST